MAGIVAATTAAAQTIPLPTPAPLPKTGATPAVGGEPVLRPPGLVQQQSPPQSAPQSQPQSQARSQPQAQPKAQPRGEQQNQKQTQQQAQQQAQQQPQQQSPQQSAPQSPPQSSAPSWLPPFFGGQQSQQEATTTALEPAQRALVDRVSTYLTRVTVMSGDFHQIGPDGRQSKGQFYVQKPGKVRFDYDLPSRIDIIADGSSVVVRDRKLATQDVYPLSQTPLRFLLADRIDLLRDTNVTAVYADDMFVSVVVEESQVLIGTSKLMIMFGAKDFQLKQWVVTDPQGYETTIAVSNIDTAKRPDPNMFRIDYTQYRN
jgi:outer membrane lipoprotein-sorting protein